MRLSSLRHLAQIVEVDLDADLFHASEDRDQWMLDVRVELLHPQAIQLGFDRAGHLYDGQRPERGVLGFVSTGSRQEIERALVAIAFRSMPSTALSSRPV